jgi:hypothetical protein
MTNYVEDALARIVEMQKEVFSADIGETCDAVPYWPYQQETFPYWSNRLAAMTPEYTKYAEDIQDNPETILMRLVVDHVTARYAGQVPKKAHEYYVPIMDYFAQHSGLQTDSGTYQTCADYLDPDTGAYIATHTGVVVFQNSGILDNQLGIEFTLRIPFMRSVY